MNKWIGNNPSSSQKSMVNKYKNVFANSNFNAIQTDEVILKAIEAEFDKKSGTEVKGILVLTSSKLHFLNKYENYSFDFSRISRVSFNKEKKDKNENEWELSFFSGRNKYKFDDIRKNDDTEEFLFILEEKIQSPTIRIESTVTHDFAYFLHAAKLNQYRNEGIKVTPFLMKKDDMGVTQNGSRLLKEKHPNSSLIIEGHYKNSEKKGNFIVVDKRVILYEFNQKKRDAHEILSWPLGFFEGALVDYFAIKTEISTKDGKLVLSSGKRFTDILTEENIPFKVVERKFYRKILGYRSGKWWKSVIASMVYLFVIFIGIGLGFGEDSTDPNTDNEKSTTVQNEGIDEMEQKMKKEEADRLAEEERNKAEAERLAEEKNKQEEAARLAEEKRKQEEVARLAEEKRKQEEQQAKEEAARIAEQKEAEKAQNVYYANCTEARAAGAAPIYRGEPGYARKLDRDGDGIACDQ